MKKNISFVFILFIWCLLFVPLFAKDNGYIAGRVLSVGSDRGLPKVLVRIQELDSLVYSNKDGSFLFKNIHPGSYTLTFMAPGYGKTVLLNVKVAKGQSWYDVIYLQKSLKEGRRFYIGGIEVTADRELLPEEPATTTRISSGEIEHIQASSLGDILELIPGQKFSNPGLENVKQIELRQLSTTDEANRNAALGTQILVDGVPLSNNANMQIDTDLNLGGAYRVTANSGIDLRQMPADNIKSIEVIRGIPSAKYGDLSAGAVVVETQSGYTPYRIKYKYNPRNHEYNVAGGYRWTNHSANFNVNYAKSLRNIRIPGDSYARIGGQINFFSHLFEKKLDWTNRFYYTRTLDEQKIRPGDLLQTVRYNRNYQIRFNTNFLYRFQKKQRISALFSVNMNRQDSYIKRIVSRDIGVIGTRLQPGLSEGIFVQQYLSKLWVKGRAWNLFGQLVYKNQFLRAGFFHKWEIGSTVRYEFNNGPGRIFDLNKPPRSFANEGDRPRPYSSIPGLNQLSFYVQDELSGHVWRDFSLQFGSRLDLFGVHSFSKTDHGTFLNPRLNFVYYLTPKTQLRAGYGKTAKSPTLSMIYPNPVYFDIVDSMYYDPQNPQNRLAIVNTQVIDRTNRHLQAFTREKIEMSLDQRIKEVGFSLTYFQEKTRNGFETSEFTPISFVKHSYPYWPDTKISIPSDTILLDYKRVINGVQSLSEGLELSVVTKKIPMINITVKVDAAYHVTESSWGKEHYQYGGLRQVSGFNEKIIPYWQATASKSEQLLIHYRFDSTVKSLGLWFTLSLQQIAMEKNRLTGLSDSLALGYITQDGQRHEISPSQRGSEKYSGIRRIFAQYQSTWENMPDLWLMNLRVSKELWKGSEVSFFVNNLLNYRPLYLRKRVPPGSLSYLRRNPEIFYGVELSTVFDDLVNYIKRFN